MGQVSRLRVVILTLLLFSSSLVCWWVNLSAIPAEKKIELKRAFSSIDGWESGAFIELDPRIIAELKLDDYLNQSYFNASTPVQLYIGYYLSAEKIGAAHDPLVCFPGQGWIVSQRENGYLELENDDTISYASMIVERAETKSLVLYWFQSHDKTNSNTFRQKVDLIISRIMGRGEENAFVRIVTEIGDRPIEDVKQKQFEFIREFYPLFIRFIEGQGPGTPAAIEG